MSLAAADRPTVWSVIVRSWGALVMLLLAGDLAYALLLRPATQGTWDTAVSAALTLATVALASALLVVLVMAAVVGHQWLARFGRLVPAITAVLLSAPVLFVLARQPFVGNRYKDSPVAAYGPWVVFALLVVLTVGIIWSCGRLIAWLVVAARPGIRRLTMGILLAVCGAIVLTDALWYVGWYPLVHSMLSLASALLGVALVGVVLARSARARAAGGRLNLAVAALLVVAIPVAALQWSSTSIWRVSTGTLYASRVVTPLRPLLQQRATLGALDAWSNVSVRPPGPAVTARPPALANSGLLITVDTLRADAVGTGNTPNIDAFFRSGQRFSRAYSQYASTRNSVRALVSSQFRDDDADDTKNLMNRLKDYGFSVIAVLPTDMKTFVNVERYNFDRVAFYEDPTEALPALRRLTDGTSPERRFVWMHLYQPHDPYEPLPQFAAGRGEKGAYLGEVRWVDHDFAEILSLLATPQTLVVFGADHGEEFREHGGTLHGRTAYDETLHVPLAVKAPGVAPGAHDALTANVDIAPTILSALGVPIPDSYQGYDLLGRASTAPADRIVYSETVTNAVAAIQGRRKWVHWTDENLWEGYDLAGDPRERRNLADESGWMTDGRAHIEWFEIPWRTRRDLRRTTAAEYTAWLRRLSAGRTPFLARLAGFGLADQFVKAPEVRSALVAALVAESEPRLKLMLAAVLGRGENGALIDAADIDGADGALTLDALNVVAHLGHAPELARAHLASPSLAIRTAAGRALATEAPDEARARIDAADPAVVAGMMQGLAERPSAVPAGWFRSYLESSNADIRAAAIAGAVAQERSDAVTLLRARWQAERSPSVAKVVLEKLLELDRAAGVAALREEMAHPRLSDYTRAVVIKSTGTTEGIGHLAQLFEGSESAAFRSFLFTAVTAMGAPPGTIRAVVDRMLADAHEPSLRTQIQAYLRRAASQTADDEHHESGVAGQR